RGLAGYLLPRQAGPRPRPRLPGETLRAMDWKQIVLFAILGLGAGSLIAGIAVGIVVTFRGSGIINLATGAVAMVAGYSYWSLKTGTYGVHVPTAPALAITFAVLLVLGLGVELCVFRPLRTAAPLAKLAASLGLLLVAQAAVSLATRAASENEVAAMLMGLSPNRLALASTLLGTFVAGGLGVLAASITQLDP